MAKAAVDPRINKITKLIEVWTELQHKQSEILDEIQTALSGEPGIQEKLTAVERGFADAWMTRYGGGERYLWRYTSDRPHIKRMLRAGLEVDEIVRRAIVYLHDSDQYLVKARHPFGLFVARVNQYAKQTNTFREDACELEGGIPDCRHLPPCKTDQEHTKKRTAEMRA